MARTPIQLKKQDSRKSRGGLGWEAKGRRGGWTNLKRGRVGGRQYKIGGLGPLYQLCKYTGRQ